MKILSTNTAIEDEIKTAPASPAALATTDSVKQHGVREPRHLADATVAPSQVTIYDPPITVAMFKELDSDTLTASVQIRHDLALEPMLKLRPNTQRRSSPVFQNLYRQYWTAMEQELQLLGTTGSTPNRLLRCLEEIKKLIINCYPSSSAVMESMSEVFDLDLLQHQIMNGTLSLEPFMEEISRILKQNCAPRRDSLVDHLVELAKGGKYVLMVREFFEILELMKLDLANYHLLSLKSTPIEVIVKMERDYFKSEMAKGHRSLETARNWLAKNGDDFCFEDFKRVFATSIVNKKIEMPETWFLDTARIATCRNEIQMLSISASIMAGIRQLCGKSIDQESMMELKSRVVVLVNAPKTKVKDLSDGVSIVLTRCNVSMDIVNACEDIINRLIRPDSPLFLTIQDRVHDVIVAGVVDPASLPNVIKDNKITMWTDELTLLVNKLNKMQSHHWTVFHEMYQSSS